MADEEALGAPVATETQSAVESASGGVSSETSHLDAGQGSPAAQPSFLEQLSEFGEDWRGIQDESEARTRLLNHAKELRQQEAELRQWQQQAAPYVQYGQQYVQLARDPAYQAWLAQKQAAAQQPQPNAPVQPAKQPDKWWNPPTFDRNSLSRYVERVVDPASGEIVARLKHDTPLEVRQAYENHQAYIANWQDSIATRPHEVIPDIIKQEVAPLIQQILAEREQESQRRHFASTVNQQNAPWLYNLDQSGRPIVDPLTGAPSFTEAGARTRDYVTWLQSPEAQTPQGRWFIATSLLHREALEQSQQLQQAQPTAADIAAQKKAAVLTGNLPGRGANHIPNRGGGQPRPQSSKPVPQNQRLKMRDRLANAMTTNGLDSVAPGDLFTRTN